MWMYCNEITVCNLFSQIEIILIIRGISVISFFNALTFHELFLLKLKSFLCNYLFLLLHVYLLIPCYIVVKLI